MEKALNQNRIWEIDAIRGLLIPGMILIHLIYDVVNLYGFVHWPYPLWYSLFKNNYGAAFVLVSGISVTLGRASLRRGVQVFGCGMIVSAVTFGMYLLGMAGRGIIIYFGVLHCLGVCMMLWPAFRSWKIWKIAAMGIVLTSAGWVLRTQIQVDTPWLIPLGFRFPGFSSSDYFPLMPNFGYFLLGAALGRGLYAQKKSRLPNWNSQALPIRCLCFMGRHSLTIYLLHQPILALGCEIFAFLRKL